MNDRPTPFELAQLAAILTSKSGEKASIAVTNAYEIWNESIELIAKVSEHASQIRESELAAKDIPKPPTFPAGLDDFLKLVVNSKTESERTKRFYKYLKHTLKSEDPNPSASAVKKRLKEWESNGFRSFDSWVGAAKAYSQWWNAQKSKSASKSARHRHTSASEPSRQPEEDRQT